MKETLSLKKSLRLLKDMLAWGFMVMWIIFLTALLSSNDAHAQSAIQVGDNVFKVRTDNGWFHVDSNGRYDGSYMMSSTYPNGDVLTITGEKDGAKNIGRHVYKLNGEIVVIRNYNSDGILVRSTRIKPKRYINEIASN
jgi:hypothetical protein